MPAPDKPISAAGPVRPVFAAQVFSILADQCVTSGRFASLVTGSPKCNPSPELGL
jgi:hypothetical protein